MIEVLAHAHSSFDDLLQAGVEVNVTDNGVYISAEDDANKNFIGPFFNAYILDSDPNSVNFAINTTKQGGDRHPYFQANRAHHLAARALNHLQLFNDINAINFEWYMPVFPGERSDNYTAYVDAKKLLTGSMSPEDVRTEAAYATWTVQQIALPNGFTKIPYVIERDGTSQEPGEVKGKILKK